MSDDFIPLSQSTPVRKPWHNVQNENQRNFQNNRYQSGQRRGRHNHSHNQWRNNSRNSSYGSDNSSFGQDSRTNIDAYLHPSMLEDPWASLKQKNK